MHPIDIIFFSGLLVILPLTWYLSCVHSRGVNAYEAWCVDIESRNPNWQRPWLANGARNPYWVPGQTIINADGTTYTCSV